MALSYKKDLDKYKRIDEDEILNQVSAEELKQLEPALEEMDPENALLPAGMRQKDQTVKKDTGTYDRERLLIYLEKEALDHEDREDVVPFTGERRDPPQLPVCKEEVPPEQQERSPRLGQEESEPLQIKEEQEELWTSQEGEQLQGLEEADIIKFTFNPVSVKCEHDDEKPQSSWFNQTQDPDSLQIKEEQEELFQDLEEADGSKMTLHPELLQIKDELHQGLEEAGGSEITGYHVTCEDGQENAQPFQPLQTSMEINRDAYSLPSTSTKKMKTEPDGEDCRVSEPASNLDPAGDLEPTRDGQLLSSDCSGTETDDSDDESSGTETDDSDDESSGTETDDSDGLMTLKPKKTQKIRSSPGFSKKGDLKRRISHTGENRLQTRLLEIPLKRFTTVQLLHCSPTTSRDMNESRPHCCDQCGKSFSTSGDLKRHQLIHTGEKPYNCDQCEKSFSQSGSLKNHQHIHTGEKPYYCDQCEKSFSTSCNLKTHQRIHTGEKPYNCDQCQKSFSIHDNLKTHQRIHTGEKPYYCDQCEKSFSTSGNLKTHQRIHTGEKPYNCDQCEKSFSIHDNLKTHQRIHTGEKPYYCDQCEKSFSTSGNLKKHQHIHTGEKPYYCDQCEKSFSTSGNLKSHQRIHTGEKPYNCDQCEKSFSRYDHLKQHQRIHTGEKPYHCDQCEKSFSRYDSLKIHQRIQNCVEICLETQHT